jgi:lipopolysaccharide biosynthesis glycosyltransferase
MTITREAATPARSDKAVVFACDGNYLRYAVFAAAQIAALRAERDFDICICAPEDLVSVEGLAAAGLRYCRVETGGIFGAMGLDARRTEASYLRLALPAAFAGEYRRLLYLDADVFVQGGDFGALLEVDIGAHPLGAVRDNMQWRTPGRRPESFARLGLPTAPYFNSGVQLIDVAAFNGQLVLERCLEFARSHPPKQIGLDQDLINAVLHGDWAELSPVWNWQYTWASRLYAAVADPHVIHFIGPKKPWKHTGGELPLRFRRAYRDFFAAHFPEAPPVGEDGVAPMANRRYLAKSLLKHFVSLPKISAYLARFPDDLTVWR